MIDCFCPYCFEELDIKKMCPDGYLDGLDIYDTKCPKCDKDIEIEVENNPVYYANKIEHRECAECKENYRTDFYYVKSPNKYIDILPEDLMLCSNCYWELHYKDLYGENWKNDKL